MWRLILPIWLALSAPVLAQVVTVRSGEHDGFTRLVLTFPEPGGWDFGRTGDGYAFRARAPRWRYDISTVFDLIPRDRLAALWVDPDSGALRLGIGCDCHAMASPFRPGIVVIDLHPGPAPHDSPFERLLANAGGSLPPLAAPALLRPKPRPGDFRPAVVRIAPDALAPATTPMERWPIPLRKPDPRADALQAELRLELARGVAAGALQPVAPPFRTPPVQDSSGPRLLPLPQTAAAPAQMTVHPPEELPASSGDHPECLADDQLDLPAWGSDDPAASQIATARAHILGEFDRPDPEAVLGLIRLYLYLGFGAEAQAQLQAWPQKGGQTALLAGLAALVDGGAVTRVFDRMAHCPGRAALWAVLARPTPPSPEQMDQAAVLRSFSELPLGLRRHLGLALADRFIAAGLPGMAQSVRDEIGRAAPPADETLSMLDAELTLHAGEARTAERALGTIVNKDGPTAPRAIVALVESQIARGLVPDPSVVLQLEAMVREQQGASDEPALRRALAKALVVAGTTEQSISQLAGKDTELSPMLWALLADRGDDVAVSVQAAGAGDDARTLPAPIRRAVARRLLDAGFPDLATHWLTAMMDEDAALLQARAALAARDGRTALRGLAGRTGAEAEALRAEAMELLGDLPGAHAAWIAAGNDDAAAHALLLARQWSDLDAGQDAALADLIAARSEPDRVAGAGGTLHVARELLAASGETRHAIDAVMQSRAVP